jgi:hypothetical protein
MHHFILVCFFLLLSVACVAHGASSSQIRSNVNSDVASNTHSTDRQLEEYDMGDEVEGDEEEDNSIEEEEEERGKRRKKKGKKGKGKRKGKGGKKGKKKNKKRAHKEEGDD